MSKISQIRDEINITASRIKELEERSEAFDKEYDRARQAAGELAFKGDVAGGSDLLIKAEQENMTRHAAIEAGRKRLEQLDKDLFEAQKAQAAIDIKPLLEKRANAAKVMDRALMEALVAARDYQAANIAASGALDTYKIPAEGAIYGMDQVEFAVQEALALVRQINPMAQLIQKSQQ
jgi:hypothetical protein